MLEGTPTGQAVEPWGLARRILFRFAFVYVALYCLPFLLSLPAQFFDWWPAVLWQPYSEATSAVVSWVAANVFQVDLPARLGMNGDITADYVRLFCHVVFAALVTAAWSLLDRKRRHHARLFDWFRVSVCFYLAAEMISYGMVKVIPNQFAQTSPERLTTMVGDLHRMSLLWTFMDASAGYTIFTGAAEVLGGLLLTCRRTRTLGALVCIGVMANVVMLNFCYDVTVKLHSSHLLALCLFVAAADVRRLVDFFVLGRTPRPAVFRPLFTTKWLRLAASALMTVLVLGFAGLSLRQQIMVSQTLGQLAPKPPLHGIWNVREVVADGAVQPPLLTDRRYWQRVIFDPGYPDILPATLKVTRLDQVREVYFMKLDMEQRTIVLAKFDDPAWTATLTFSQPASDTLVLEGSLDGRQVRITLRHVDESRLRINQPSRLISDRR
jgi:hypothetical protein